MTNLHVLVTSRNRIVALIECLNSLVRISPCLQGGSVFVYVQDNSDEPLPPSILNYFSNKLSLSYHKNNDILPMALNWHKGLENLLKHSQSNDLIAVIADRRLMTKNILALTKLLNENSLDIASFDHQRTWLNSSQIRSPNYSFSVHNLSRQYLMKLMFSGYADHTCPMLFNCLVRKDFYMHMYERFQSFAEGSCPDMNFFARFIDSNIPSLHFFDAPCIATNARHVMKSNGQNFNSPEKSKEFLDLSGFEVYPRNMHNFITSNVVGSISRYWSDDLINQHLDVEHYASNCLVELGYPSSLESFRMMKLQLEEFINTFEVKSVSSTDISSVRHIPLEMQSHPINYDDAINNSPDISLFTKIECQG